MTPFAQHLMRLRGRCTAQGALLLAMLGLTTAMTVHAAPTCPAAPVRVALYENGFFYKGGQGLDKDVVDELQKRSKCKFEVSVVPRVRIWSELEAGSLDMTTSVVETPERKQQFWLLHYIQQKRYAVMSKEMPSNIKSMQDFLDAPNTLRMAMIRGFKTGPFYDAAFDKLQEKGRVEVAPDSDKAYQMLQAKRVSGLVGSPMVFQARLKELGLEQLVQVHDWAPDDLPTSAGMALSRKNFSEEQVREWGVLIDAMRRDGTMLRLIGKYLPKDLAQQALIK